jgi:CheY-like chemotaxis protein
MLVGQILAFSRQSLDLREVTNLNALLLESFQIMQTGMPKSINLSFSDNETNVHVLADSNQLSQVFINALTNAYEAIDEYEGEISLSVSTLQLGETTKFLHGELARGRYALVKVVDNGEGLAEDEIEKMFDPFYTSKELGSGMGLAIARGIVIGHGGAIDIESILGSGTTVSIVVPVVEKNAKRIEPSKPVNAITAQSTIVLVDDQEDLLETVAFMLKELGHECIPCVDPKIALDVIGNPNLEIDLVITDYSMPGLSGLDIRKFCAKHRPNVPVILATGYSERIAQDEHLSKLHHYVLNKPFGFRELKEILSTALTEH